jgi:hypothetical protein
MSISLSTQANLSALRTLCGWNTSDTSSVSSVTPLITSFISAVNGWARPSSFTRLGITRENASALSAPNSTDFVNKSVVITWKDSGGSVIYSSVITPPVTRWCP